MTDLQKAVQTQLANIERKTGKKLSELHKSVSECGKAKHGEIRSWLMEEYGVGHGDANVIIHTMNNAQSESKGDPLSEIYAGKKAHLRPIHDKLMEILAPWGEFEVAPKKAYVSLRRKKQFAMLGPKSNERAELGINCKDDIDSKRIVAQKPGGMCQYIVTMTEAKDFDKEVIAALRKAFDAAG